jgi:hypothetical protein
MCGRYYKGVLRSSALHRRVLVACRRESVTALGALESVLALEPHKDCLSGALALLTFSLRQATSVTKVGERLYSKNSD